MAIAVVVGTVIGSGVFKKPMAVAKVLPSLEWVAVVWVAVGVLAILGALTLAEIAVLYPRAGGNYVFLREGYGRWAGFLWGWVEFWIIRAASQGALATIFTESFRDVLAISTGNNEPLGFWGEKSLTMSLIMMLALVNIRGVRWGGGLQLAVTLVKIVSLLGIMLLPWIWLALSREIPDRSLPTQPLPIVVPTTITLQHFLTAVLAVLWAYHGWMNIAPVAGEVSNPSRNIPLALFVGVGIVMFLYLGANVAYHKVLPMWEMANAGETPVATLFCERLLGDIGALVVSAAIMFSVFGALNGGILVGPRLLYAMGEDGLAPRALGAVHARFHTPALAILVMSAWSALLVLVLALLTWFARDAADGSLLRKLFDPTKDHFDMLTDFTMFGAMTFETLAITTIFVFRARLPNAERPYRCFGYPFVPALYLILPALVLGNMFVNQQLEAMSGVGFILVGAVVYFLFYYRSAPK
jgi:basic amino acid/polyamine antiporter, APA family